MIRLDWKQAPYVQVGLKTQYEGSQGQIMFFLGNKGAAPLEKIIFVVPPQPQFQFQLAPVPQRLDPKQQVQASFKPHSRMLHKHAWHLHKHSHTSIQVFRNSTLNEAVTDSLQLHVTHGASKVSDLCLQCQ